MPSPLFPLSPGRLGAPGDHPGPVRDGGWAAVAGGTSVRVGGVDQTAYLKAFSLTMRLTSFDFALETPAVVPQVGDLVFVLEPAWDGQVVSVTHEDREAGTSAIYTITCSNTKLAYASPAPFGLADVPDYATLYPYKALKITNSLTNSGRSTKGTCTIYQEGLWPGMTFTLTSANFGLVAAQYTVSNVTVTWPFNNGNAPVFTIEFGDAMVTLSAWAAGTAAQAPDGSISGTKITDASILTPKLAANSITTALLAAGAITADKIAAVLILASAIKTATSGARVEFDTAGFRAYDSNGAILVNIPDDGSPASFVAAVQATTLIVTGNAQFQGTGNALSSLATLTLQAGVQAPNAAPILTQGLPAPVALTPVPGFRLIGQGYADGVGNWVNLITDGQTYRSMIWVIGSGAPFVTGPSGPSAPPLGQAINLAGYAFLGGPYGLVSIGSNVYILGSVRTPSGAYYRWGILTVSSGAVVAAYDASPFFYSGTAGSPMIATDGTYLYVNGWSTQSYVSVAQLSVAPLAFVNQVNLALPAGPNGGQLAIPYALALKDLSDGNGLCYFVSITWLQSTGTWSARQIYQFTSQGALIANTDWSDVDATNGFTYDQSSLAFIEVASGGLIYTFTNWTWTTASSIYWVAYSWYDDAGTVHETAVGPRASITMSRRHQLTVSTATIPVGGADDPDKVRIYMLPNATDPGAGNFKLQATDALTVRSLATYSAAGAADGGGVAFPGGTGAVLKSSTGLITIKGDGTLLFGSGTFPTSPATSQLFFRTDIGMWFRYDGTRWVGEMQTLSFSASGNVPLSASAVVSVVPVPWKGTYSLWLDHIDFVTQLSAGTSNSSNYWPFQLNYYTAAEVRTAIAATDTRAIAAVNAGTMTASIAAVLNAAAVALEVLVGTATGAPPNYMPWGAVLHYRIIAT